MPQFSNLPSIKEEGIAEEQMLMTLIIACLLLMPLKAFSTFSTPLYGLTILLETLFIVVSGKRIKGPELDMGLLAAAGALILYLTARWIGGGGAGAERILQTLLFLLTLITFSRFCWNSQNVHRFYLALAVLMVACLAYWLVSGRVMNYYHAFYGHSNGFAVVIVATLAITFLDARNGLKKQHWAIFFICAALLAFANSRSAFLTIATFVLTTLLFMSQKKRRAASSARFLFAVAIVGALAFSIVYPSLLGTDLGRQLEFLSREYLNKNFFSGREVVWKMVLEAVSENQIFGLGLQVTPSMIYSTGLSSHNLYLQTVLQSGIVGLILLLTLFGAVLSRLCRKQTFSGCVGASLLIAMMVHECLEVALTQNNFNYGLLIWAVLGICLALNKDHLETSPTNNNNRKANQ